MEFGLSGAILLAGNSVVGRRPLATWSATRFEPAAVADLLASWIVRDRPNSITLSSSLAGRSPALKPARELVR